MHVLTKLIHLCINEKYFLSEDFSAGITRKDMIDMKIISFLLLYLLNLKNYTF